MAANHQGLRIPPLVLGATTPRLACRQQLLLRMQRREEHVGEGRPPEPRQRQSLEAYEDPQVMCRSCSWAYRGTPTVCLRLLVTPETYSFGGTDVRPFVGHTKGTTKAVVGSRRPCFPKGALPSTPSKVLPAKSGLRNQIFGGTNLPIRKKANSGFLFGAHRQCAACSLEKNRPSCGYTSVLGPSQAWFPQNGHRTLDKQRNALLRNASPSFGPSLWRKAGVGPVRSKGIPYPPPPTPYFLRGS